MKKMVIAACALLFAGQAMAIDFEPKPGLSWQGKLGFNASRITNSGLNGKAGINLGLKADYMLPNAHGTYISGGVEWTQKGAKKSDSYYLDNTLTAQKGTHKINEHYISIPLHVGFRYNINKEWGVYGELGPYFAIGLGGFHKFKADAEGAVPQSANWSSPTFKKKSFAKAGHSLGGFQRFDSGFGILIGGEYMNQYSLNLGFDWGFTDMLRDDYRNDYATENPGKELEKLKNFNLSLTVGYRF